MEHRKEKDFINKHYGISDIDHDTALEKGHIYDLMEQYANEKVKEEIERINKYGRHQFNRGSVGSTLVKFEDWKQD